MNGQNIGAMVKLQTNLTSLSLCSEVAQDSNIVVSGGSLYLPNMDYFLALYSIKIGISNGWLKVAPQLSLLFKSQLRKVTFIAIKYKEFILL